MDISAGEGALLGLAGLTSIAAVPFALAGAIVSFVAVLPMLGAVSVLSRSERKGYTKNKATLMAEWTKRYLEGLTTEENINAIIIEPYSKFFKQQIAELFEKRITVIKDSNTLQKIQNEYIHAKRILQGIQPMQMRTQNIISQLRLYILRYPDKGADHISVASLFMYGEVGFGEFSTVYRVIMHEKNALQRDVILKVKSHSNTGSEVFDSLNELDCLK